VPFSGLPALCHPALDAGSRQMDWIPVFTGMTRGKCGNDKE